MGVRSYRDLKVWQHSMMLVKQVYYATQHWPQEEKFGLTSQVRRAAVSIPSNIAEGQGRRSDREFHRFLNIAHGSLMEVETQLLIAKDLGYLSAESLKSLLEIARETGKMLFGLLSATENS